MTADSPWPGVFAQALRDLAPFPGRFDLAWRIALLCALVTAAAMLYRIPEAAISCYLIIFLMRPDASECIGQAVGLIVLATIIVALMVPLINATADTPLIRIVIMAGASFAFLYLSSATQLGEIGAIIGLVIAFILTLVSDVPAGEIATRGLLYAWKMAVMPMALMIVFCLLLGRAPHRLVREKIAERLERSAAALDEADPRGARALDEPLEEGNADLKQKMLVTRLVHLAPGAQQVWLAGAIDTSYRMMLAVSVLRRRTGAGCAELSAACRRMAAAVSAGAVPPNQAPAPETPSLETPGTSRPAETDSSRDAVWSSLEALGGPDGGSDPAPVKQPFFLPDAFTNPDHQRYALKTTAAAIICYLIYTGIGWQGIQTAMVTCYVAALGTTGETVRKLVLRISGCLVGAAMGVAAIAFVIPSLDSVGGLMVLVFAGVLVSGWVAAGSERIAYAGVQIGLAFLLTILDGFAPSTDMSNAGNRIAGILLGNVVVFVIFTGLWPKSAATAARAHIAVALEALSRLAAAPPASRAASIAEAAEAEVALGEAAAELLTIPFEPRRLQPEAGELRELSGLLDDARALVPVVALSADDTSALSPRLADSARALAGGGTGSGASEAGQPRPAAADGPGDLMLRIEQRSGA